MVVKNSCQNKGRPLTRAHYGDSLLYVSRQLRWSRGVRLHSRFWARFAGWQREAEPALEHRDPFRPPQRAADGGDPLDPGRRRRVGRHREKSRKIGDQRPQPRHRRQLVILARELRPSARPWRARNGSPAARPSD
jgi:hypothetical protein